MNKLVIQYLVLDAYPYIADNPRDCLCCVPNAYIYNRVVQKKTGSGSTFIHYLRLFSGNKAQNVFYCQYGCLFLDIVEGRSTTGSGEGPFRF